MTTWITMILIIITLLAILYTVFKKCQYVSSLPRVYFPLYPFSTILRGTARTDIFVEVVNLALVEAMWVHFRICGSTQLQITGYPHAYDMHIIKLCCCRQLQVDWQNIVPCDLDRNIIKLPALGENLCLVYEWFRVYWNKYTLSNMGIRKSFGFGHTPRN